MHAVECGEVTAAAHACDTAADGLRRGVEIRADWSLDELHQSGRHSAGAVQHGPDAEIL